jgi:hypothetical protein
VEQMVADFYHFPICRELRRTSGEPAASYTSGCPLRPGAVTDATGVTQSLQATEGPARQDSGNPLTPGRAPRAARPANRGTVARAE